MAKVSNEVQLIIALWKKKLREKNAELAKQCTNKEATESVEKELDGIEFAEQELAKIIYNLEAGQFGKL